MGSVRWGVMSTAWIAVDIVVPSMQKSAMIDVVAIASRDLARAKVAAEARGIPVAYGSYEELLAAPDVDAVYIPLPNSEHVRWAVRALEAGKHVLCEKPIAMDAEEARTLLKAARAHPHLKVMEALMYRFHPQWQQALRQVRGGALGELRTVHSFFSYFNRRPDNIRNRPDLGGGGLLDIGSYNVSVARFLFGTEPRRVVATVEFDPDFRVDRLASAILDFGPAGTATFTCGTQLEAFQRVLAVGTQGLLEIEIPFNPPLGGPTSTVLERGNETTSMVFDRADHYTLQGEAMSRAILDDTPVPTPLEDAVANMEVLDAVFRSAEVGTWVEVGPG